MSCLIFGALFEILPGRAEKIIGFTNNPFLSLNLSLLIHRHAALHFPQNHRDSDIVTIFKMPVDEKKNPRLFASVSL